MIQFMEPSVTTVSVIPMEMDAMNIIYLELGVGFNTPSIIKYNFWNLTNRNPKATYACLNYGQAYAPGEIQRRSICLDGDIDLILKEIRNDK